MFPPNQYTPHGYLDNPYHSWRLRPSGVLRSVAPLGLGWHVPSFAGPYNHSWHYRAFLRFGFSVDSLLLLTAEQFAEAGCQLFSPYHSSRMLTIAFDLRSIDVAATFYLVAEDAFAAAITLRNQRQVPVEICWCAVAEYERNIGGTGLWDYGLSGRADAGDVRLWSWAEGTAIGLTAGRPADSAACAPSFPALAQWLQTGRITEETAPTASRLSVAGRGPQMVAGGLRFVEWLGAGQSVDATLILGRGQSQAAVGRALQAGWASAPVVKDEHWLADARFWTGAFQLSGDWPAHWRHGVVYDFETLRMIVRPAAGVFGAPWDGMQLQAPRLVLAEAALDAFTLALANPSSGAQLLLAAFEDAPAPNVPCIREDGSPNMIAADGSECGTSPAWGFPIFCADQIYRMTGDRAWLERLYQPASHYLTWWLQHRTDSDGWLHYACSWESGQDDSPRFGPAIVGPEDIRHIRPVDLHAAVAQATQLLAAWARQLDRSSEAVWWQQRATEYAERTLRLWRGGWFRDFDAATGHWVDFRDVMHLSPGLAGIVTADQCEILAAALADLPPHGRWLPLEWPPVAFTVIEAAIALGRGTAAGRLAADVIDRAYQAMDARSYRPEMPLPGIGVEHWPASGAAGAEGYGWGALPALFLVRAVLGVRPGAEHELIVAPALPEPFLVPGRRYRAGPLHCWGHRVSVTYQIRPDLRLDVQIDGARIAAGELIEGEVAIFSRVAGPFVLTNGLTCRLKLQTA